MAKIYYSDVVGIHNWLIREKGTNGLQEFMDWLPYALSPP